MSQEIVMQLRSGLTNYIGAILQASELEVRAAKQLAAAALAEEILRLAQNERKNCDLFVAKPLLRANVYILQQRCNALSKVPAISDTQQIVQDHLRLLKHTSKNIEEILKGLEELHAALSETA